MLTLRTTWFGSFLMDGERVVEAELFPNDAKAVAHRLGLLQQGELLPEERRLAQRAPSGVLVTERRQLKVGSLAPPEAAPVDLASRGEEFGFPNAMRREAFEVAARGAVSRARGPDLGVVQAVRAFDELRESENRLNERLREWYGLHFPELARLVATEKYAALVASGDPREAILKGLGLEGLPTSGSALSSLDLAAVRTLAQASMHLRVEADGQATALASAIRTLAPNLSQVVGPLLAARLIESAGSIQRLARMPSSTVQVLGAERALFRHLKEGKKPPKHGLLFQHPAVHTAPFWARGRIARALAGKATIAARVDFAGRRTDLGSPLLAAFEKRAARILAEGPTRKAGGRRGAPSPPAARRRPRP